MSNISIVLAKAMAAKPELIGKLSTMANLINHLAIANVFSLSVCACVGLGPGRVATLTFKTIQESYSITEFRLKQHNALQNNRISLHATKFRYIQQNSVTE